MGLATMLDALGLLGQSHNATVASLLRGEQVMRRRASALVEFALVAPILVMLVLLMVQYGMVMHRMLALSHAAREAARYAAVHPEDDEAIREKARGAMRGRGYRSHRMNIVLEPAQGSPERRPGRPIKVTVQYDMSDEIFLPTQFFGVRIINPVVTVEATAMIEAEGNRREAVWVTAGREGAWQSFTSPCSWLPCCWSALW